MIPVKYPSLYRAAWLRYGGTTRGWLSGCQGRAVCFVGSYKVPYREKKKKREVSN